MPEHIEAPSIGRIVHYIGTDRHGERIERPAIIVRAWGPTTDYSVNLQVFMDGENDGHGDMLWVTSCQYSEALVPRSWHWPKLEH